VKAEKNAAIRAKGIKNVFTKAQNEQQQKWGVLRRKRLTDKKDQLEAKKQKNCMFSGNPLLQKKFRDAVKDHCHITGRYRGAAHNNCNVKLRINPKTTPIPVVFHNLGATTHTI